VHRNVIKDLIKVKQAVRSSASRTARGNSGSSADFQRKETEKDRDVQTAFEREEKTTTCD